MDEKNDSHKRVGRMFNFALGLNKQDVCFLISCNMPKNVRVGRSFFSFFFKFPKEILWAKLEEKSGLQK